MAAELKSQLVGLRGNPPVDEETLQNLEKRSGIQLPIGYRQFMKCMNGGEGVIGRERYVVLWRLDELIELNAAYEVQHHAPNLFAFGSSGGGEAYAFDTRANPPTIVAVPFIGMDTNLAVPIASDFEVFLSGAVAGCGHEHAGASCTATGSSRGN